MEFPAIGNREAELLLTGLAGATAAGVEFVCCLKYQLRMPSCPAIAPLELFYAIRRRRLHSQYQGPKHPTQTLINPNQQLSRQICHHVRARIPPPTTVLTAGPAQPAPKHEEFDEQYVRKLLETRHKFSTVPSGVIISMHHELSIHYLQFAAVSTNAEYQSFIKARKGSP